MSSVPLISVIIPMYNAEKYIRPCLDSVLNQTFKDYEIIVVDDLSIDHSVELVEDIIKQHPRGREGRIHLLKRKKNSGGSAVPRNVGLKFSHGKYIAFLDNDDLFTSTALEELFTIAEQTNADVLHAEKWFAVTGENPIIDNNTKIFVSSWEAGQRVTKPEFVTDDIGERVIQFSQHRFFWHVWSKLFRRDFLAQNCLEFPNLKIADDMLFSFYCLCLAKNYVRIPNIFNIYRLRQSSTLHNISSEEEKLNRLVRIIIEGTQLLDDFMNDIDFFVTHSEFKHVALNFFIQNHISQTIELCSKKPPYVVENFLRKEFSNEMGNNAALLSYLFNITNINQLKLAQLNKINSTLVQQLESLKNLGK